MYSVYRSAPSCVVNELSLSLRYEEKHPLYTVGVCGLRCDHAARRRHDAIRLFKAQAVCLSGRRHSHVLGRCRLAVWHETQERSAARRA